MLDPPKFVDVKYLEKLGILYFQVSLSLLMVFESAFSVTSGLQDERFIHSTTVAPIPLLYRSLFLEYVPAHSWKC